MKKHFKQSQKQKDHANYLFTADREELAAKYKYIRVTYLDGLKKKFYFNYIPMWPTFRDAINRNLWISESVKIKGVKYCWLDRALSHLFYFLSFKLNELVKPKKRS